MRLLGLLASLWLAAPAQAAVSAPDDTGQTVTLPRPAKRIIALAPHVTELLYAAGAGSQVVASVEFANHPESANKLPRVGSYSAFDLERIAALQPDLAIAWGSGNPAGQVAQVRRLGIPVFVSEPRTLDDIPYTLHRFGQLAGTQATAEQAARGFHARRAALAARHAGKRPVTVFYEIWNQPLMTVGGSHLIGAALALCGGRNVFQSIAQPAATVDLEAVLRADPEVIVASGMGEARPDWLGDWRRWPKLAAVRRGNLFFVPPDLIQRHTPRILDGTERLCEALDTARQRGR